jgi:AraC family ethanolamine operon transcriptional activator
VRWNIETTQLQKGTYRFSAKAVHTRSLQLARTWRSLGTRISGGIPPGTIVLAFALNPSARVQFRGRQVQKRELIVQENTCGLDFSFMDKIDILTIAVSGDELDRRAELQWGKPFPVKSRTGILRFSGTAGFKHAGQQLTSLLDQTLGNAAELAQPAAARRLENAVLDGFFSQLEDHCKAAGTVERHRAARRAASILHERCKEDHSITDLCDAVGANRRTLHLGFLELYGIPPMKYLRALRLCGARRDILTARAPKARITEVATTWGFSHLGRFAAAYKSFFGKLPSLV